MLSSAMIVSQRTSEDPRGDGGGGRGAAPPDERGCCSLIMAKLAEREVVAYRGHLVKRPDRRALINTPQTNSESVVGPGGSTDRDGNDQGGDWSLSIRICCWRSSGR